MSSASCCLCKNTFTASTESLRGTRRNNEIENNLKKEKRRIKSRQMILLLGTGESGKSTFLKQMKIINGRKFSLEEIKQFKDYIYDNIYKGVLFLLNIRDTLNLHWTEPSEAVVKSAEYLEEHYKDTHADRLAKKKRGELMWTEDEFISLVEHFTILWNNETLKEAFNHRSKMLTENFSENSRYYLNRLKYIGVKDYKPTDEDIVWSRKPTEAIIEEEIALYGMSLVFIDVGGQTKERHKWCQFFSDMNSVLFLIASSHFDEYYQDRVTKSFRNKLYEALIVFQGLINHVAFRNVSIILFFNKTDILKEKITAKSNIFDILEFRKYSQKYNPYKIESVQKFLLDIFASCVDSNSSYNYNFARNSTPTSTNNQVIAPGYSNPRKSGSIAHDEKVNMEPLDKTTMNNSANSKHVKIRSSTDFLNKANDANNFPEFSRSIGGSKKRLIYKHFTTAVDRQNIEAVFNAMQDTVLQNNIKRIMMN